MSHQSLVAGNGAVGVGEDQPERPLARGEGGSQERYEAWVFEDDSKSVAGGNIFVILML